MTGFITALNDLKLHWALLVSFIVMWMLLTLSKLISIWLGDKSASGSWLQGIVIALNMLNTPLLAILVIVLGMVFDMMSSSFGINSDAATGVIGAGIGMLTGQATRAAADALQQHINTKAPNLTITDTREEPPK